MKIRHVALMLLLAAAVSAGWAQEPSSPPAPAYTERDFSVGEGDLALPGTLAMPQGAGPFPAVVLVHGSGPQDRDSTIGPNRPLRDIAHGLAERGIATLRYDKRTKVYPIAVSFDPGFNVDRESTDDTVAAVAALRATPGVDPGRVFVFGHSLGAMLTPRIVQRAEGAAGGIMLAASPRSMLDLIPEQMERMAGIQGVTPAALAARLEPINDLIARLRAGEDASDSTAILGAQAAYLRSADALDPVADARALQQPLLILHGGHDIQVTDADWQGWVDAFTDDPRITLKRYPQLGHLGIAADPDRPMATYQEPGVVDEGLIDEVARWILAR